tara:strand:+ start:375 stop:1196 length:822 start_codon:yes stop_codon:yes gene_type:complete
MKMRHNKKRNTAFVFEALIKELAKTVVRHDKEKRQNIILVIKEHFGPSTILGRELENYRALYETTGLQPYTAEKLLCEIRNSQHFMSQEKVFEAQTTLIRRVNKEVSKNVFNNFVPNYKFLATIYQVFNKNLPSKKRVILEEEILTRMIHTPAVSDVGNLKNIDELVVNGFTKKFNEKYASLHEEQRALLESYVSSLSEDNVEFKIYLNEELKRLKTKVFESYDKKEIKEDPLMFEKVKKVGEVLESFFNTRIDETLLKKVLKIQGLTRELEQ